VGGIKTTHVDVRLIAATNRNLEVEIESNRFRKDLYYRLNVVPIHLSPLRERNTDVPALVRHFIEKYNKRLNKKIESISDEAISQLQAYPWPGNIREFQNVVERMAQAVTGLALTPEHIPEEILRPLAGPAPACGPAPGQWKERLEEEEKARILAALRTCKGNMTQAARELGMARNTLYRKVQKF